MPEKFDNTQEWNEKTLGETYNTNLNYYNKTDLCWRFYNGDQWFGIKLNGLSATQYNVCAQGTDYIRASILSRPIKGEYNADNIPEPLRDDKSPEAEKNREIRKKVVLLNKAAEMKWEKEKMESKLRDLLLDAACSGDMATHTYFDASVDTKQNEKGDFHTEIIDGANVMFGNPNVQETEKQPYILVIGRDTVQNLKSEAERNKVPKKEIEKIISDRDTEYQVGEWKNVELEGSEEDNLKATYVVKYERDPKTKNVFWSKSTKHCVIRSKVDLGINRYPIAFANWKKMKNSYHGNSLIFEYIENQKAINQLFALVIHWARMSAFGKVIIDSSKISQWSNKIGEVIKADGSVNDVVKQLEAGQFNSALLTIIDMNIKYTKDFIGANEASLGQINPERASGTAIMLNAKQAAIPHANILANLTQFVEDIYLIWGEFFLKKYNNRTLYVPDKDGRMSAQPYNSDALSDVLLSCKVNVGQSNIWSEPMLVQNLDNLLARDKISTVQYLERIATLNLLPDVQGLITDAKEREIIERNNNDLRKQIEQFMKTGQIPPQWLQGGGKPANPNNAPELQGNMGRMAQNNLRSSQPKQGVI